MREPPPTHTGQPSFFSTVLQQTHSLFTAKRVGYTVAGAFAFVGTAAALSFATSSELPTNSPGKQHLTVQNVPTPQPSQSTTNSPAEDSNSAAPSAPGSASNQSNNDIDVNVNGQDIPVPENGTTHRTVTSSDGSHTSVDITSNSSSSGSAANKSTTSFNLDVTSDSSTTGGTSSE